MWYQASWLVQLGYISVKVDINNLSRSAYHEMKLTPRSTEDPGPESLEHLAEGD